jgi:hypothetical protein
MPHAYKSYCRRYINTVLEGLIETERGLHEIQGAVSRFVTFFAIRGPKSIEEEILKSVLLQTCGNGISLDARYLSRPMIDRVRTISLQISEACKKTTLLFYGELLLEATRTNSSCRDEEVEICENRSDLVRTRQDPLGIALIALQPIAAQK